MIWKLFRNSPVRSRRQKQTHLTAALECLEDRRLMTGLDTLGLTAATAIVTDAEGNAVGDLNPDTRRAMASTTKMMTALLVVEHTAAGNPDGLSLDDVATIGFYPAVVGGSTSNPNQGEQLTVHDMLRLSLLRSDNEITQALAEYVVGETSTDRLSGVEINLKFTKMMNARAADLGLTDTNFRSPHGRDPNRNPELGLMPGEVNDGHYSSARDLATLGTFVMKFPDIAEIVGTSTSTSVTSTRADGTTRTYNFGNGNGLVNDSAMPYPGANGVKGGGTGQAGWVLVSQATILGNTLNGVVMDSDDGMRNIESHAILNYGFEEAYDFIVDSTNFTVQTKTGLYDVNSEVFRVNGTDYSDNIMVRSFGSEMEITVNGVTEWLPVDSLSELRVDSGGRDDWIRINDTPESLPIVVKAGSGNDVIIIGSSAGLNIVDSFITVDGGTGDDELQLIDLGTNSGQRYEFTETSVVRSNMPELSYENIDDIFIFSTSYNDTFIIDGLSTSVDLIIDAGGGSDWLEGADRSQTWYVTGDNSGHVENVTFSQLENLTGGSAADTFRLSNRKSVKGVIDGGSGRDTLNYSSFTAGVVVDLQSGAATNVRGGLTSIENVTGSRSDDVLHGDSGDNVLSGYRGNDILVGRGGNDTLINVTGRSLMIGGKGSDTLLGGFDQDLMIGGTTKYDDKQDDLKAIMKVWANRTKSYSERVSTIQTGVSSGGKKIALTSSTVVDDRTMDELFGAGEQDWFWLFADDSSDRTRSE